MNELHLDFHGVTASIRSDDAAVIEALRGDFAHFAASPDPKPRLHWRLERREAARSERGGVPILRLPGYTAYALDHRRLVAYRDGALAIFDRSVERGVVVSPSPERLRELGYLALLSRAGESLERVGLHRAHALGFTLGGRAALVFLPSGGGKSTLALRLLARERIGLLSDDTPLVGRDGLARAFPLRLGFQADAPLPGVPVELVRRFNRWGRPMKKLVDYSFFRERVVAQAPVRWLILGAPGGRAELAPASAAAASVSLADGLILGRGVAQMSEYMLGPSPGRLADLARLALSRARAAGALMRGARILRLRLGRDPEAAATALLDGLQRLDPE
jgi:hypothetical protein